MGTLWTAHFSVISSSFFFVLYSSMQSLESDPLVLSVAQPISLLDIGRGGRDSNW